ncbi:MAG: ATP-binding cassette domain-containing protein [Prevotellaceae bacterium]|jgi:ABC-2 type transport system ATP-binding protein|nr:ATP-binding cassette domain-containing protein [Prevotellaceae bacterium]
MDLLIANDVVKRYTNHLALDGVSVSVPTGSIYGLLGPNGAGKTTLIRIINQITAPDAGQVLFDNRPLQADDILRIGYLPEERGLYKKMKVGEQALYLARLKGMSRRDAMAQLKAWFTKFEIQAWWNRKVEELSKGMAQKVQFIVTILHKPKLLIFDEPFSGFDPVNVNLLKQEILNMKAQGSTIIFSTHNMASVEELCDSIALINKSKVIVEGKLDEVRRQYGDNIVEVAFRGDPAGLQQALHGEYTLLQQKEQNGIRKATIKITEQKPANHLLQQLLPQVEIVGFNEIIPSMNDIFIKLVS